MTYRLGKIRGIPGYAGRATLALLTAIGLGTAIPGEATAQGAQVLEASSERLNIEIDKGILIRLNGPATDVFLANAKIADVQVKSPTLVYVYGKEVGETTLYAMGEDEQMLYSASLSVSQNLSGLTHAISQIMPDAVVEASSMNGLIILTGHVSSPSEAETVQRLADSMLGEERELINHIQIATPTQVNLQVKIAEVGRSTLKQIGVNWENTFDVSNNVFFGLATGRDVFDIVEETVNGQTVQVKEFNTLFGGTNSIVGSFGTNNVSLDTVIDALETEGLVTVLAEPNLTSLSGETASFLVGGEFPFPVAQGDDTVSVEFKPFGIILDFTPFVLSEHLINLRVRPEVSSLASTGTTSIGGLSVPGLSTRRAETTVELASGQSFAIAGLLQNNTQQDITKTPFLGDIPILGALFKSDAFRRSETELVIVVTPHIVRPVSNRQLALPTDRFQAPSDIERYLHGKTYREQPSRENPPASADGKLPQKAAAGFVLQ